MPASQSHSSTTAKKSTSKSKDALSLLKSDHRKVEELFEEYENARRGDKKIKLVKTICQELLVHAELEETEFYPVIQQVLSKGDQDMVMEARVEHSSLRWLIQQLLDEEPESELYEAKVVVLKEYVMHHVQEEEKELFPKVKKTDLDLRELGETMEKKKEALTGTKLKH